MGNTNDDRDRWFRTYWTDSGPEPIPSLTQWGLLALALVLAVGVGVKARRVA